MPDHALKAGLGALAACMILLPCVHMVQAADAIKIKASNCQLEPKDRTLSGFILASTVGVITALHGVADCPQIDALQPIKVVSFPMRVSKEAAARDLALLVPTDVRGQADLVKLASFELARPTDRVNSRDPVAAVGYPHGVLTPQANDRLVMGEPTMERLGDIMGIKNQDLVARKSPDTNLAVFKVSGLIVKGESGAPLIVQANGRVIGVVIGSSDPGASNIGWVTPLQGVAWTDFVLTRWNGKPLPNALASTVGMEQEGAKREYIVTLSRPGRADLQFKVIMGNKGSLESLVPSDDTWETITIRDAATGAIVAQDKVGRTLKFQDRDGKHDIVSQNVGRAIAIGVISVPAPPTGLTVQ
jgi:hypothetical protein